MANYTNPEWWRNSRSYKLPRIKYRDFIMNRVFSRPKDTRATIFQEFTPITLIGRLLGVFPVKIGNALGNQVFVTSRGEMIYSIILLGLSFVHLIYMPQMTVSTSNFVNCYSSYNYTTETFRNPLANPPLLIRLLNGIAMSLMAIFSKINAISYVRSQLPAVFASLKSIDGLLGPTPKRRRKNIRAIFILAGLSILVGLPGQIHSSIFVCMSESYIIAIYMVGNNVNNLTAVLAEAQFVALCFILKSRFDIINEKLLEVWNFHNLEKRSPFGSTMGIVSTGTKSAHLDIKFLTAAREEFIKEKKSRSATEEGFHSTISVSKTVKTLRIGHQRLCDVLDQVNHMFQLQLVFSILGCFLNGLFNMNSFFSGGAWKSNKNTDLNASCNESTALLTHPLINLSWGIYYASRIVAMAVMASKTIEAAKHALIHILDVRRSSIDLATKEELNFFYDHLTSRKIEFSAAGFFSLDIALISSVVTTGSTYLVMMVQLHDR